MKMTEDESDVFEITDFTTASEWERFIARFEEIIHEWKLTTVTDSIPLSKEELTNCPWEEKTQELDFAGFKFIVSRRYVITGNGAESSSSNEKDVGEEKKDEEKEVGRRGDTEADQEHETIPMVWQDMMSLENDFPPRAHCLCRWYGLRDFVVVFPAPDMQDIDIESRMAILLSSVSIAVNNTTCQVPVFIAIDKKWRKMYQGCFEIPGFRTSFEMVHLKYIPSQYQHLAGLLDVFKAKLANAIHPAPPVSVAVRFTYMLSDWMHYSWSQSPPDIESFSGEEVGITEFGDLPFGACEDPICELQLSTTWPSLSEEMIVDNDVYSDLDPLQAPHWSVRVRMTDNPLCLLGDYLDEFVKLCRRRESTDQLLGNSALDQADNQDMSGALERLTQPGLKVPSIGTVVTKATSKLQIQPEEAPIPKDLLNEILTFLFPDAKTEGDDKSSRPSSSTAGGETSTAADDVPDSHSMEMFKQFKSAPSGSLTYRLAVCMCIVNHSYGGLRAVAHLWQEIVLEMRYRWENNYLIPDIEEGSPNMGCSILHQKFQMLNCCIERKKKREAASSESPRSTTADENQDDNPDNPNESAAVKQMLLRSLSASSSGSDDEFFECEGNGEGQQTEDMETDSAGASSSASSRPSGRSSPKEAKNAANLKSKPGSESQAEGGKLDKNKKVKDSGESSTSGASSSSDAKKRKRDSMMDTSFQDTFTHQAEGRLSVHEDMHLLNVPSEKLYVPVTQEPSLMTEDMLEEHAVVLEKLGTSAEGAHLRARMQSACLLSDMESFKAANPGSVLGDFVRWYSPRDWVLVEEEDEEGNIVATEQLSQRMQIPGNMWVEVWQSAKPVPARRQRRLFDDTKEAEKVLHWLAALKPSEAVMRLMPMLMHAAIVKLLAQDESELPQIKKTIDAVSSKAAKAMRIPKMEVKHFEELVRLLSAAEVHITRAQSLKQKLEAEETAGTRGMEGEELLVHTAALLESKEVAVVGAARSPLGQLIHKLFQTAQKSAYMMTEDDLDPSEADDSGAPTPRIPDFPAPLAREYILRTAAKRPAPWSRQTPQRMYCTLVKEEFRLCGAFTTDTTFQ